jgi:ribosomal protein L29
MSVDLKSRKQIHVFAGPRQQRRCVFAAMLLIICCGRVIVCAQDSSAQNTPPETSERKIERLTAAVAQAQAQMETYQKQLLELQQQLTALKQQLADEKTASSCAQSQTTNEASTKEAADNAASLEEIREQQAIEESQIATHDITKVETQSKYPLKVSGLILFNGFVNTRQVDISASPDYAVAGPGSTGLSLRQTMLGLDASGPHLFNATSHADLRVDFFANDTKSNYAASGLLRLRTAHAALSWQNTEAFVEVDRSILEPNEPSSLVALAQPELAWAGNLWSWNPQVGVSHQIALTNSSHIKLQSALIDTSDPPLSGSTPRTSPVSQTERSRWPGTEARIAFQRGESGVGQEIGIGGYFSPHRTSYGNNYDAWATTIDLRSSLTKYLGVTANAYRGQALAGLGGGGYMNYLYYNVGSKTIVRALDDVGGWAQLKASASQRVEINAGYGIDNPFAHEIDIANQYSGPTSYAGLERNRSIYSNVIYSPRAYLMFSVEYKRLWSSFSNASTNFSDVIGIGAGYKF